MNRAAASKLAVLDQKAGIAAYVKGFGCRPHDGVAAHTGPASESLQRRKPRWGDVGRCRVIELVASNNLQTIRTIAYGD